MQGMGKLGEGLYCRRRDPSGEWEFACGRQMIEETVASLVLSVGFEGVRSVDIPFLRL